MKTYNQTIAPGAGMDLALGGRTFLIQSCDAGNVLSVTLTDAHGNQYPVAGVGAAFKAAPQAGFTRVTITSPVTANIAFIVTNGDVDLQLANLTTTINNGTGNPVPVSLVSEPGAPVQVGAPPSAPVNVAVQGTVTVSGATLTATNVGINNDSAHPVPVSLVSEPGAPLAVTPTQASSVSDVAPTAVPAFTSGSPNQVHFRAAGACRALRVSNPLASTGNLYVGGAGVTPTNAVIVLQPGDVWNETDAPQIDWYATSDTGATVNVQVIA